MSLEINPIESTSQLQPGEIVGSFRSGGKRCIYDEEAVCLAPHQLRFELCRDCPRGFQAAPPEPTRQIFNHVKNLAVSLLEFMGL